MEITINFSKNHMVFLMTLLQLYLDPYWFSHSLKYVHHLFTQTIHPNHWEIYFRKLSLIRINQGVQYWRFQQFIILTGKNQA